MFELHKLYLIIHEQRPRGVDKIFHCLINTRFYEIKLNFIGLGQLKLQLSNLRLWKILSAFNFNTIRDCFAWTGKKLQRNLPTALIRRHLTMAATIIDKYPDGYIRSVFHTLTNSFTDGINSSALNSSCQTYRRIYRWIYSVGISNTHR